MIDIITVIHNEKNTAFLQNLTAGLNEHEPDNHTLIVHDNSIRNIGFGPACNLGAKQATMDIIGFLNPDVIVHGPFIDAVERQFEDENLVITGCNFRKTRENFSHIGLKEWVCGAAFFVRRDWFNEMGGFYWEYLWGWEETDLCKQAEEQNLEVRPIELPLEHDRSHVPLESKVDKIYKGQGLRRGKRLYHARWG